jgi:flagella basal body P-ring formation protein FlgA
MLAAFLPATLTLAAPASLPVHPAETAIRDFVALEARAVAGRVEVHIDALPRSLTGRDCATYRPTLPAGARLWGRTVIALNCIAPQSWVAYVPINIAVHGRYLVTAQAIPGGHVLTAQDLRVAEGELTALPDGILREPGDALGLRTRVGLAADLPLTSQQLLVPPAVRQGETVKVIARGPGFAASSEGVALASARAGETVRVRMPSGQTVSGIARAGGLVELVN